MAALYMVLVHCPKNILNLGIETEPVTVGADATIYVWFLGQIYGPKNRTYAFESAPAVTGSVFMGSPPLFHSSIPRILPNSSS